METCFRILGALHLMYGAVLFGILVDALKEDSGIELPRAQWGIKAVLLLAEVSLLLICGCAALLLEPSAFAYALLALVACFLVAFSDTVALRGPRALVDLPPGFYLHVAIRGIAASALFVLAPAVAGT